jgi:hypothetical protein
MASISTCPYCGALVRSDQQNCPGCGAANELYVTVRSTPDLTPGTIEELQDYCSAHKVPLSQLRFFIGENRPEPRVFGIYRDGGNIVVYKNKSDGSRSIGYQGPDEERAVTMLYRKLLETGSKQNLLSAQTGEWSQPLSQGPPKTIEELQAFCRKHNMPLRKMHFFIGENYPHPMAFGIYRDGDEVVVYKNKSNGERTIRYRGKFEERGVKEIYEKLLDECHRRGIYPDGNPGTRAGSSNSGSSGSGTRSTSSPKRKQTRSGCLLYLLDHPFRVFIIIILLGVIVTSCTGSIGHRRDGYYQIPGDDLVYYRYGDNWYYSPDDDLSGTWYEAGDFPMEEYEEYSLGDDWDMDWGVSDFRESSTWDDLHSSSSSSYSSSYSSYDSDSDYDSWDSDDTDWGSSDYDSWDSGDTDWDSDW